LAHLQTLDQNGRLKLIDLDIVGAYDVDPERLKVFGRVKPGIKLYEDAASLIRNVDAVFVSSPTKFHFDHVVAASQAGKDVFCEKPMATNLAEAEKMLKIVERAGVKAQVGLVMRYEPLLNYAKQLIDTNAGQIELPICILIRDDQCFPIRGAHPTSWRKYRDLTGGGTLIEHSIHDIDVMRWLFGDIDEVRATSRSYSGHEVEDEDNVWLKFENGAEGILTSIWHEMVLRNSNRLIEIFYYKAFFHFELDEGPTYPSPPYYTIGDSAPVKIENKKADDYFKEKLGIQSKYSLGDLGYQDLSFIRSIQADKKPQPSFEVGVYAHRVVDAAYRSARNNSTIKLRTE
jgi:predicted dehydrogenase